MNCDRIAPFYRYIEGAAFGRRLQRHRLTYLHAANGTRHALVLGDGDGRFTAALVAAYPLLEIDFIDASSGMLTQARNRIGTTQQVRFIQADATEYPFQESYYDVAFSHFFLDCFDSRTADSLIRKVASSLTQNAGWIISEFQQAPKGWRKYYTKAWLSTMYAFFRITTELQTREIPDYRLSICDAGFSRRQACCSMAGLITSEWWAR